VSIPFIHLRVHSEFSIIDGLVRVKPLINTCVEQQVPAVALTDQSNLFALVKFYKNALSNGVKPIAGADIWLENPATAAQPFRCTLFAQNAEGYGNLIRLISQAHLEGQYLGTAIVKKAWLADSHTGLIMLSGAREGDVGAALIAGHFEQAVELAGYWASVFDDRYYIELQRTGSANELVYLRDAMTLAETLELPVVATNDVRFLKRSDFEAHEARVCIHEGRTLDDPRRPREFTDHQYLKSVSEMNELFSDIPEALENTVEIARRCNLEIELGNNYLPSYPVPEGITLEEFFKEESRQGLAKRLASIFPDVPDSENEKVALYRNRLELELDTIIQMGFPGYFLIVMDFIRWAKNNGIPVGPGRGSGAGSLVAYALEITDLDPLAYDLLFERFLNPERVSMPDFDIDFCMEGRDSVIEYVAETYGRDAVSQIITFGTMAAKGVVRDVARVQGKPYGLADKLSKLIPFEVGMTLEKAMAQEKQLREFVDESDEAAEIMDMAYKLEGIARNVGKHAGGVVISPTTITDFSPLYCDETGSNLVTQYDKDDVEKVGLVKFDFLGLRTLTIIDWAIKAVNEIKTDRGETKIDISRIPLEEADVYKLLQSGETTAVFQLESRGMKDLIRRLLPNNFEDITALVALYRPGPLQSGMVDDFISRKHGRSRVQFPHPDLEPVLKNTYGVILYQEQVMQIAQVLASYSLGQADLLRRAMGKKKQEEMDKQRQVFLQGCAGNNISEKVAGPIFDLMEKFAGYGFNKSHSAAYALLSYQTAWLKTFYPAPFMAAVLSADMQNTDKVVILVEDCRKMNLPLVLPNVNSSQFKFSVDEDNQIVYGLGAIKGLGEGPVESIVEARVKEGPFENLFEFCSRVDLRKVNRRSLEALIRSGALDDLGPNRAVLMTAIPDAVKAAEQRAQNQSIGINDMFGNLTGEDGASAEDDGYMPYFDIKPWTSKARLQAEKDTLGLYLRGHPIDEYEEELRKIAPRPLEALQAGNKDQRVCGLVFGVRTMRSKRGGTLAFVTLDDRTSRIEVALFGETYEAAREVLIKDSLLVVEGEISNDEYSGAFKMRAKKVYDLVEARRHFAEELRLTVTNGGSVSHPVAELKNLLHPYCADGCPVVVQYNNDRVRARFKLGNDWSIKPNDEALKTLRDSLGDENVELRY